MDNALSRTRSGSETRQRERLVQIRCTPAEYSQLEAAAERAGMSIGAFMRQQALGTPGPRATRRPPIERTVLAQLLGQLGRCGSNVNQIARVLNSGGDEPPMIAETMAELRSAAAAISRALGRAER